MSQAVLNLPLARTTGTTSNSAIGTYAVALGVQPTLLGGFFASPIRVPLDFNRTQPSRLYVDLAPSANSVAAATFARLELGKTVQAPGAARVEALIAVDWPVPNPWNTTELSRVLLDNGTGYTFNANEIPPAALIGLRLTRNGPHANDTWPGTLLIAQNLQLQYLRLYPWEYCC
jgi:hypothetical protein